MITALISRLVILAFGTLYPAYASYKAVRTKDVKEYVKWMMYWIVFALFTFAETFTDVLFSFWFPFYYELKVAIVFWLLSPATKGSSFLYRNFVHPALQKRESEIDEYLSTAKEKGYSTVMTIGSKGVTYATNVIVQTAIRGSGGIFDQLRKSYSLSDLSPKASEFERNPRQQQIEADTTDAAQEALLLARNRRVNQNILMCLDQNTRALGVEEEMAFRALSHYNFGHVRSTEDISTAAFSNIEQPFGVDPNPLTRTASMTSGRGRGRGGRTAPTRRVPLTEDDGTVAREERFSEESVPSIPLEASSVPVVPQVIVPDRQPASLSQECPPVEAPPQSQIPESNEQNEETIHSVYKEPNTAVTEETDGLIEIKATLDLTIQGKTSNVEPRVTISESGVIDSPVLDESIEELIGHTESPDISEDTSLLTVVEVIDLNKVVKQGTDERSTLEVINLNNSDQDETDRQKVTETNSDTKEEKETQPGEIESSEIMLESTEGFGSTVSLVSCTDSQYSALTESGEGQERRGRYRKKRAPPPPAQDDEALDTCAVILEREEDEGAVRLGGNKESICWDQIEEEFVKTESAITQKRGAAAVTEAIKKHVPPGKPITAAKSPAEQPQSSSAFNPFPKLLSTGTRFFYGLTDNKKDDSEKLEPRPTKLETDI